jgi:hypothetical protein
MEGSLPSSMPVLDKSGGEATDCLYLQFEKLREWMRHESGELPLDCQHFSASKRSLLGVRSEPDMQYSLNVSFEKR